MKVEASSTREGRKAAGEKRNGDRVEGKRGCGNRRTRRRVHATSTAIQRLFLACKAVFKGPGTVPAPADVEMLRQLLDKMGPQDVGLSTDLLFFKAKAAGKGTPRITYTTIYSCENFSMCIFFLPPTAVIPLHNHPGMTVFSKLLLGSMHVKSYDWVHSSTSNEISISTPSDELSLAQLVVDSDFTAPCNTCILYPTSGGNMHTFRALTACAVLDVLGPPYSKVDDRDCTYYQDYPYSHNSDVAASQENGGHQENMDRLRWLQGIDMPKDLKMDGVEYLGPQILMVDSSNP